MDLNGVFPALVTPFRENSTSLPEIDWESWEKLVEWQIESGVSGLVVLGTTGESATLSKEEKLEVCRRTVAQVANRVPIIVGTGSNNTHESLEMTKAVSELGVQAALAVTPYYNKPSQAGLIKHFSLLADEGGLPLIIYNVPSRTVTSISIESYSELSAHPNIIAGKQAVDSISELVELSASVKPGFSILAGDDSIFHSVLCCGGTGVISATASALPKEMIAISDAYFRGDIKASLKAQQDLLPAISVMFSETNPTPAKAALAMLGIIAEDTVRLPLVVAQESTKKALAKLLTA
ncbi:UNVERIFIED_CONTAM: hypothetical protein GTU68_012033 [Idotea baltica]|nr:hypothetical protein [Idotea baltica]